MNKLRLVSINLHAPYKVMQDPERDNNFHFVMSSYASLSLLSLKSFSR